MAGDEISAALHEQPALTDSSSHELTRQRDSITSHLNQLRQLIGGVSPVMGGPEAVAAPEPAPAVAAPEPKPAPAAKPAASAASSASSKKASQDDDDWWQE